MSDGSPVPTTTPSPKRRLATDLLLIMAILAVMALLALTYARPWMSLPMPARADLQRYIPLVDGQSSIQVTLNEAGEPIRWTSSTVRRLPVQQALAGRPRMSASSALGERYPGTVATGVIPGVDVWEIRSRILEQSGDIVNESVIFVREDEGDFLLNVQRRPGSLDLTFTPALWLEPAQLAAGQSWSSSGMRSDSLPYHFDGRIAGHTPYTTALGIFDDCLQVQTRTVISSTDVALAEPLAATEDVQWNCADVGAVEFTSRSIEGAAEHTVLLASTLLPGRAVDNALLPPITPISVTADATVPQASTLPVAHVAGGSPPVLGGDPANWALSRLARTVPEDRSTANSSIPPVYLPGETPLVLSAARKSDLTAYDLSGAVQWRFHTGGTIYSPPTIDVARGRLYFGSSDKHLYAVDRYGFFIWSYRTSDNVATRPLLVDNPDGDLVIFGSEDRVLYAVDAERGELRWQFETGGPIVSGLAQVHLTAETGPRGFSEDEEPSEAATRETLILFGNDDGGVYALNSADGEPRWQYGVDDAVEAPLIVVDDTVLVTGHNGVLYAVDATSGAEIWQSEVSVQTLRTAPVVSENRIFVVDDATALHALDLATGRKFWSQVQYEVVGSPLLLHGEKGATYLVAAGYEGGIYLLDLDGQLLREWVTSSVRMEAVEGAASGFELGPSYGGGALWLADDSGVVYRLGPASGELSRDVARDEGAGVGPIDIQLSWMQQAIVFPFRQSPLTYTPLAYDDLNLALDNASNLYTLDPASGAAEYVGTVVEGGFMQSPDPILVDDTLLALIDNSLYAVDPANGAVRWQHAGMGRSFTPVTSDGDVVVWLTSSTPEGNEPVDGAIVALDAVDGVPRWEIPLSDLIFPSGVHLAAGTVYAAVTPAAYDADTGALRWTSAVDGAAGTGGGSVDGFGVGIPGLDVATNTLYVCHLNVENGTIQMVSYDTEDGQVRWRVPLEDLVLNPFERPWTVDDVLIVPALDGTILGLETADGSERWRYTPPVPRLGAVTVAEGRVWTLLQNGNLVALDAKTGQVSGQMVGMELELSASSFMQRPLVQDNSITVVIGLAALGYQVGP